MNSMIQFSTHNPQTISETCEVLPEVNPSSNEVFPEDQDTFEPIPFDDEPLIEIVYDTDIPPDPLAEDSSIHNPWYYTNQNFSIKLPFSAFATELPEPYLPKTFPHSISQCSPPTTNWGQESDELQNCNMGDFIVISDGERSSPLETPSVLDRSIALNQRHETVSEQRAVELQANEPAGDLSEEEGNLIVDCDDDERSMTPSVEKDYQRNRPEKSSENPCNQRMNQSKAYEQIAGHVYELAERLLVKMDQRKLANDELTMKKRAETAVAQQLVRRIMRPDSEQKLCPRHSPRFKGSVCSLCMEEKQQRNADNVLARRLIKQISKGSTLKRAFRDLQSDAMSHEEAVSNSVAKTQVDGGSIPVARIPTSYLPLGRPPTQSALGHLSSWQHSNDEPPNICRSMLPATSDASDQPQAALPSYSSAFGRQIRVDSYHHSEWDSLMPPSTSHSALVHPPTNACPVIQPLQGTSHSVHPLELRRQPYYGVSLNQLQKRSLDSPKLPSSVGCSNKLSSVKSSDRATYSSQVNLPASSECSISQSPGRSSDGLMHSPPTLNQLPPSYSASQLPQRSSDRPLCYSPGQFPPSYRCSISLSPQKSSDLPLCSSLKQVPPSYRSSISQPSQRSSDRSVCSSPGPLPPSYGRSDHPTYSSPGQLPPCPDSRSPQRSLSARPMFSPPVHLPPSSGDLPNRSPPQRSPVHLVSASPLSAVHPSHLLPPTDLTSTDMVDEAEGLIATEIANYSEEAYPVVAQT